MVMRGLLSPLSRRRLPFPAAMIRHFTIRSEHPDLCRRSFSNKMRRSWRALHPSPRLRCRIGCTSSSPFKAECTYPVASDKAGYSPSRFRNSRCERCPAPSWPRKLRRPLDILDRISNPIHTKSPQNSHSPAPSRPRKLRRPLDILDRISIQARTKSPQNSHSPAASRPRKLRRPLDILDRISIQARTKSPPGVRSEAL